LDNVEQLEKDKVDLDLQLEDEEIKCLGLARQYKTISTKK
jgi:hypothetical protein